MTINSLKKSLLSLAVGILLAGTGGWSVAGEVAVERELLEGQPAFAVSNGALQFAVLDGLSGSLVRLQDAQGRVYLYDNADIAVDPKVPHIRTRQVKALSRLDFVRGIKVSAPRKVLGNYTKAAASFRERGEFGVTGPAPTEIYTRALHEALPISPLRQPQVPGHGPRVAVGAGSRGQGRQPGGVQARLPVDAAHQQQFARVVPERGVGEDGEEGRQHGAEQPGV